MSNRKSCNCAICETSNLASICTVCVNFRLNEYYALLKSLRTRRDRLNSRLTDQLVAKGKADEQLNWKILHNEKIAGLKEKLRRSREQLRLGKSKLEKLNHELNVKYGSLEFSQKKLENYRAEQIEKSYRNWICTQNLGLFAITSERLHKQTVVVKQICKLFPQRRVKVDSEDGYSGEYDVICSARLPRGLNPHSVPSEELAASLGYMVQLLNIVVQSLGLPSLHNSGFAGSCSRIWQRDSYWDARPSSRSHEYPLFIPRQNSCSSGGENSWSDRSSNQFEVATIEPERKSRIESSRSISFNYSCASPHSMETHNDLQKGIALLKKSVACVTSHCYNSLCLDVPSDASTFEAFAKLLATLSSSKEIRSVFSLKATYSRSSKQVQQPNKSVWNVNSMNASSTMLDSAHSQPVMKNGSYKDTPNSGVSFLYTPDISDVNSKSESLFDGWDLVEHPTFPPPPSETEDIEHWTRAMFTDATRKNAAKK